MKKLFLSIIPLLLAVSGFCQELQPVKLDNEVTVSLFPGYQKKDTVDQATYSVNALDGYMVVIREPNAKDNTPLKKASDLNNVLKTYISGIQAESANSVAENVRDTTVGQLKAKLFTLKTDNGGDIALRDFLLLYTKGATYTFEYVYSDDTADIAKEEGKAFFSSVRLSPDMTWTDQYLSKATGISPTNKIELFGGAALLLMIVFVLVTRKRSALG
ncbi:MAG TPA: hypothetical protein VFE53_06920 [Mucilaginibacter sp.]|jgi:hypothetical protein|nr:hypothetical protein [Mucilaginibacter sp.]